CAACTSRERRRSPRRCADWCATTRAHARSSWRSPGGQRMSADTHVIVGAGLAGAKAAEALREEGFEGRVVLIGDEPELPYERPPLSKDYLRGEAPREQARVHSEGFYAEHDIELLTATAVTEIDTAARSVALS